MRLDKINNRVNSLPEQISQEFTRLPFIYRDKFQNMGPYDIKKLILPDSGNLSKEDVSTIKFTDNYFCNVVTPNKNLTAGTKRNYKKSINHFHNFLTFKKLSYLRIPEFTNLLALKFKDYLTSDISVLAKKGISEVSSSSIIIKIKTIFERALDAELIKRNPFKGIKLKTNSPQKPRLTATEVAKLKNYDFLDDPKFDVYRDLFLFSVYTRLAYQDLSELRKSDLIISEKGYFLETARMKTKMLVKQFLVTN